MATPDLAAPEQGPALRRHPGREILEAALRRPLLVGLAAAASLLCALTVACLLPPRYRASSVVQAEWDEEDASVRRMAADGTRGFEAVRQRALGRPALERVLKEEDPYRATRGVALPPAEQLEKLRAATRVQSRGANELLIECEHADPAKAALVSSRLASLLIENTEIERAKRAQANPSLLAARLADARKATEAALAALRATSEARSGAATGEAGTVGARQEQLQAEKSSVAAALSAARVRAEGLREAIREQAQPPAPQGNASAEIARLRAERTELRRRYTDEHPDVEALARRIRRLEASTSTSVMPAPGPPVEALAGELRQVEDEIETLSRKNDGLDTEIARLTSGGPSRMGSRSAPDQGRDLVALNSEFERTQKAYAALQDEVAAAEVAWRLSPGALPRLRVVRLARVPAAPFFPNRLLFGLVGLALGVALGASMAVATERRDPTVRGPDDLRRLLPQPLLAEIPLVRARSPRRG